MTSKRVTAALAKLAAKLERNGIDYCVVGGNALNAHGFERATVDVDVLMTSEGRDRFVETCLGRGFARRFEGAQTKFKSTVDDVPIDVIISGTFPGESQREVAFPHPKDISFEESYEGIPEGQTVRFIDLPNLINLKLLSYRDLPDTRMKDMVDVINLIEHNNLNESFVEHLHPSVHQNYFKALDIARKNKQASNRDGF